MSFYVNIGILLASLVSFLCSLTLGGAVMAEWGWRVPFFFGAAFGFVVVYLRRALPETLQARGDGRELLQEPSGPVSASTGSRPGHPLRGRRGPGLQLRLERWSAEPARSAYNEDPTTVFAMTTILGLILVIGCWMIGRMADRKSMSRWFLLTRSLAIPSVFLMLLYIEPGIGGFTAVLLGGSIVLVLNMTIYNLVSTSLMPKACRATGVSLGYGMASPCSAARPPIYWSGCNQGISLDLPGLCRRPVGYQSRLLPRCPPYQRPLRWKLKDPSHELP